MRASCVLFLVQNFEPLDWIALVSAFSSLFFCSYAMFVLILGVVSASASFLHFFVSDVLRIPSQICTGLSDEFVLVRLSFVH